MELVGIDSQWYSVIEDAVPNLVIEYKAELPGGKTVPLDAHRRFAAADTQTKRRAFEKKYGPVAPKSADVGTWIFDRSFFEEILGLVDSIRLEKKSNRDRLRKGFETKREVSFERLRGLLTQYRFHPPTLELRYAHGEVEMVPRFDDLRSYLAFLVLADASGLLGTSTCPRPKCGESFTPRTQDQRSCGEPACVKYVRRQSGPIRKSKLYGAMR